MKNILKWFKQKPKDKREKVSDQEVRTIRIMVHHGDSLASVARHFNISRQNVWLIVNNKTRRKA